MRSSTEIAVTRRGIAISSSVVACGAVVIGVAACGGSGRTAAQAATPPTPIAVSALIGSGQVTLSPSHLGAGPIVLTVTNQAARAESLEVMRGAHVAARTAPINPQGSTQVEVALHRGTYHVATASAQARTDAQRSQASTAPSATLRVGAPRSGGGASLLTP